MAIILHLRLNLTVHAADLPEEFWARFREEIVEQLRASIEASRPEPAVATR